MRSSFAAAVSVVCASMLVSTAGLAGPLNPPAGPVASTPGPEPRIAINAVNTPGDNDATPSTFKITQPGSYYLSGNLTAAEGKDGIEIAASNVTIDLNGFTLAGANSNSGIVAQQALRGLVIRNGMISQGFADRGIRLRGQTIDQTPIGSTIEDITINSGVEAAIDVGSSNRIASIVIDGASSGIYAGTSNAIRDCVIRVGTTGISADSGSTVEGVTIRGADTGISIGGRGSVVRDCTVTEASVGITASNGVGTDGILIQGCTVSSFSNLGIVASGTGGARLDGNTVSGDPSKNPTNGIWGGDQVQVTNNVVRNIRSGGGSSVGILILGLGGRANVRGNTIVNCDKGIKASNGGNAIYSNELTQNTKHFELAAGNRVGPISTGPLSAQIDGNTGGSGMGSTDPTANFIY
ncbi:MAG: right-handed parallel beta-helix repeat-containing protein [Phycisphaerales bacterium]|nr:right-handed parallel beta-helix repeat-containing protein [Phycisphaerales bacterium]